MENFGTVLRTLPQSSYSGVCNRVGWLNCINPWRVDKLFELTLINNDARIVAMMLAKFAAVEPGDNFLGSRFRRTNGDLFVPGWELPGSWTVETRVGGRRGSTVGTWDCGVPNKGQLVVVYSSAPEDGCKLIPSVRGAFHKKHFLLDVPLASDVRDVYLEDDSSLWDS
jgi:hypothetical protein